MTLVKCGRVKINNSDGSVSLSDYASATVEGTLEEVKDLEKFMDLQGWETPCVEANEIDDNKYCQNFDFDKDQSQDFKYDYKKYKQAQQEQKTSKPRRNRRR